MKKKSDFILRNLTTLLFLIIYIIMVLVHLFLESFIADIQLDMLLTMLPFFIMGIILDFILSRNTVLPRTGNLLTHLLPSGVFVLIGISVILQATGRETSDKFTSISGYMFLIFIAAPFFISSYDKETHKKKMICAIIGCVIAMGAYLYLTTLTAQLDRNSGMFVYLLCYFMAFYSAAGIPKIPYLSILLGALNALVLLFFKAYPITYYAKLYGWDYDISNNNDFLIIGTLAVCILVSFAAVILKPKAVRENA